MNNPMYITYDHMWIMMLDNREEERPYIIEQMYILEKNSTLKEYIQFVLSFGDEYNIYNRLEVILQDHFPNYLDFYNKVKLLT